MSLIQRVQRARQKAGGKTVQAFFQGVSAAGRAHPKARRALGALEIIRDVPYGPLPVHTLDVYRPRELDGPAPAVLYIHGGGFRILSKDTHWLMGITFARMGAIVFSINYRLAPKHPYPAAVQDACQAAAWLQRHAADFGADPDRIAIAGESAGANLACSVGVAAAWKRPEPWAAEVFDAGLRPRALFPACGMLQVSDVERLIRRKPKISRFVQDRMFETAHGYLGSATDTALADPLLILESDAEPDRPIAPMFIPCGTRDPLLDDSRRLAAACARRGVAHELRIYPGGIHAFHAFAFVPSAVECWRHHGAFFQRHVP